MQAVKKEIEKNRAPAVCDSASALPLHWGVKKRRKMMKCILSNATIVYPIIVNKVLTKCVIPIIFLKNNYEQGMNFRRNGNLHLFFCTEPVIIKSYEWTLYSGFSGESQERRVALCTGIVR